MNLEALDECPPMLAMVQDDEPQSAGKRRAKHAFADPRHFHLMLKGGQAAFEVIHSSSPVLFDTCTVEGPGGGVIPLRSLAGAPS